MSVMHLLVTGALPLLFIGQATAAPSAWPEKDFNFGRGVRHSNLGGLGPDGGEKSLLLNNVVLAANGRSVDLRIRASSNYMPGHPDKNRIKNNSFGVINMPSNTSSDFYFSLLDSGTNQLVAVDSFNLTIFDLDIGKDGAVESVTVSDYSSYYVTPYTEIEVMKGSAGGATTFKATTVGTGADNPTTRHLLTEAQKARAVTVRFDRTSEFWITFTIKGGGRPRNLLFAGWSIEDPWPRPALKAAPKPAQPAVEPAPQPAQPCSCHPITVNVTVHVNVLAACGACADVTTNVKTKSPLLRGSRRPRQASPHLS
mmetsp:Transcript_3524/g.8264  ORF Transcript_3524/g.8264 Transcript_3524/m.8264 type:complete len:312 (-) Transcript_3524:88-1023(-)